MEQVRMRNQLKENMRQRIARNMRELAFGGLVAVAIVLYIAVMGFAVRSCAVYGLQIGPASIAASIAGILGMLAAVISVFWLVTVIWGRGSRAGGLSL